MQRIGFSSCCFPEAKSIKDIIDFCLEHQFSAMELEINTTNFNPLKVKISTLEWIKELNVSQQVFFSLHSPGEINFSDPSPANRKESIKKVQDSIQLAADLDVDTVVVHPGRVIGEFSLENRRIALEQNINAIRQCALLAKKLGVIVSVENLCHEKGSVNPNIHSFFDMCKKIDLSIIGVTLDTNHAGLVDGVEKTVSIIGRYVNHIHFSSNKGQKSDHCEPAKGIIDFYAVADFLKYYRGLNIIELNQTGNDSGAAILRTRDYLFKLLTKGSIK